MSAPGCSYLNSLFFSLSVLLQVLLFKRERRGRRYLCGGDVRGRKYSQTSVHSVFGLPSVLLTGSGYSLVWLLVYKTLLSSLAHVI